jgi:hypothetical protein
VLQLYILIIITSEMIFIVFSAIFFFKTFWRNKSDPMPLKIIIICMEYRLFTTCNAIT